MKCPHCLKSYHPQVSLHNLGEDKDRFWRIYWQKCPSCDKFIIELRNSPNGKFLLLENPARLLEQQEK